MRGFILKEAEEKRDEILAKAQEEYNLEKSKIVLQEKKKIQLDYERKEKAASVQKRIAISHEVNQSRIRVLKAQDDCIQQVSDFARKQLAEVQKDSTQYKTVMRKLIAQGLERMRETEVLLVCREADRALVQSVMEAAKADFEKSGFKLKSLAIDTAHSLPAESCGGVILSANYGRVSCNNTLETRLQLSIEKRLPEIRCTLFPSIVRVKKGKATTSQPLIPL
eukprot:TRINITY_DN5422_c0_g1_i1.p2 TRINITY_DN5422_c0_g1~~TRINITY_DN5422_c0_g1_i1.p2  ORF type:complete len:258 (+),score=110.37 TRINITY_DN5422_c0_g1_i1:108-776(+)